MSEPSMSDCLFCKISSKAAPAYFVHETNEVAVFLDIYPVHPGHILIVPKTHAETIDDLSLNDIRACMEVLPKVVTALKEVTHCEGYTLLQNNGKAAGQVIPHVHFHVIPRWSSDGLRHWAGQSLQESEGTRLMEAMRTVIQS